MGRRLGSFRVLRKLGSGGMGAVYLAEHVVIGSRVAVKVLHPSLSSDPMILQRFHAEARAVNLIGHDNILKIYDLCREGNLNYLVMEYLEGRPLSKLAVGPLAPDVAIPVLVQICDALAAAHDNGVVHRDLKPENIFLTERRGRPPFVKLLDFGVAKLLQDSAGVTAVGMIVGTPAYMAPEQFKSGSPVDGRTDIYALGVLSYQLATGTLPFSTQKLGALMRSHLEATPPPPQSLVPELPAKWAEATLKALAKNPEDRFQDARAMREALLSILEAPVEIVPPTPVPAPPPAAPAAPTVQAPRPPKLTVDVDVLNPAGVPVLSAKGMELTEGGVFLAAAGFSPPLFSRLRLALRSRGGALGVECEVVRQVTPAQAIAWNMSEGVGVQFLRLTEVQRRALGALMRSEPLPSDTPTLTETIPDMDQTLKPFRAQVAAAGSDPYLLLDVSPDADVSAVRARARDLRRALKACQTPQAAPEARAEAEVLQAKVERALQTLTDPAQRAEYDATRGNHAGVAQAIAAGLTVTELDRIHRQYLAEHPRAVTNATLEATCGRAYEQQGEYEKAADAYERALRHDPLDLSIHQRLTTLRRRRTERARAQA